jgi:hypothetical protein
VITSTPAADGGWIIQASVRQPSIYLDQDSLSDLARVGARRDRFLEIFRHKGTLLFSWTNAIDIAGPQDGTKRRIREFLDAIGPQWIPLEMNPYKVVRREQGYEPTIGTPCVSESFFRHYYPIVHGNSLTLAQVVDLVHEDREAVLASTRLMKEKVAQTVKDRRRDYERDSSRLDETMPPEPLDPARPAKFILRRLERLIVSEARSHTWMLNDSVDFCHAAVAGAYADLLLLDKHWRRRVLEAAPARAYPWVFYRKQLDEFLDIFEQSAIVQRLSTP